MFPCSFDITALDKLPVGLVIDQYYQICKEYHSMILFHGCEEHDKEMRDRRIALIQILAHLDVKYKWSKRKRDNLAREMEVLAMKDVGAYQPKRIHENLLNEFNESKGKHLRILK